MPTGATLAAAVVALALLGCTKPVPPERLASGRCSSMANNSPESRSFLRRGHSMRTYLVIALLLIAGTAYAAPCIEANADCAEWIVPGGGPARFFIYRNHALDANNARITRGLVMVHGLGRDADNYFRHVLAAAFLAGALEDTVVIAPRFASNSGRPARGA